MFGQNDNGQPADNSGSSNGTDFSQAMNDLANNGGVGPSDQAAQTPPPAWGHPGQPLDNPGFGNPAPDPASPQPPVDSPPSDQNTEGEMQVQDFGSQQSVGAPGMSGDDLNKLIELKQKALSELNPLVEHLDQNNEEKFNTLMMMIQASDDQSLIKQAYDVANNITDDKARAQALLDIVNEINYFTQQR